MTRRYLAIYEWAGKNFSGHAPDVPGCIITAKTVPKLRRLLKEGLEAHLQWFQDDGEPLPEASSRITVARNDDPEFPNPAGYYLTVEELDVALPRKKRLAPRKSPASELTAA